MQQYVMNVEPKLIEEVDYLIKQEKLYSSRNEFIRDAIRSKIMEYRKFNVKRLLHEAKENALKKGWDGNLPTTKERNKIAEEVLKRKHLSLD